MTTDSESSLPSSALPPARYPRIGSMSFAEFRDHFARFVSDLAPDERVLTAADSPLAEPLRAGPLTIGNRFTIHPMEGWDGERDGNPGPLTIARWRRFGESGAKLIWGGEAVAVREDGRGNPNQLYLAEHTLRGIERLRRALVDAHVARFGSMDGLVVGLQLTHSGRFSHFDPSRPSPRIAFEHPILDRRITPGTKVIVLSDEEIDQLVEDFVRAARQARELGFDFVDIKHSHGYLLHELLGAHTRAGRYGGSFENRTRFLRNVVTGVRREAPGLEIGVRVSAFDLVPFRPDPALTRGRELGPGIPEDFSKLLPYRYGFGVSESNPTEMDLDETERFLALLRELGIRLVNISGGSPYYNPHCQRPALYPPSDGYRPPEDPLAGVARHLAVTRDLARKSPDLVLVGSGLSYLQDYFPHVAQAAVRAGWMSSAGLGRMVLSYPDLPADCLEKGKLERKKICRTFSDCTTAPRHGLVSGCYPLDPAYRDRPEATVLRDVKRDGGRADPSASSETKGMRD